MPIQISGVQMGVITGGPSSLALSDLSDVSIVSPQTGQYLRYNAGISEWQNAYLGSDIYDFLNTNMTGSNGVDITYTPGPNTIDIALALTASGDATGSVSSGNLPLTLATVNSNVGTYGSGTAIPVVTVNAKGLITSVTTASFTGTSPLATSLAGGSTGALPYQSSANNTAFLAAGTSSQILIGGAGAPSWSSSVSGLTAVSATTFTGALSGNATTATTLQTTRSISISGDATWTVNFDGSANASAALTLATVNANAGTFASVTVNGKGQVTAAAALSGDATTSGSSITLATVNASPQTNTFRKVTVNGKGLVTATSAVAASDITTALGFTPVNVAGDTMLGNLILNADPSVALGAATKQYVDNVASGVTVHAASVTSTTAALPASTYNNGASGVGATLTANANGAIGTVGGYASLAVNNRVLVKDQASALENGIYVVTQLGSAGTPWILTRASDFDGSPASEIQAGDATYVQNGTLAGTQWIVTTTGTITVGTTAINFSQFSGPGTYTGGSGINVTGTTISNTGVLSNIAGTGIGVSGATGNVTITNNGVVSVAGTSNQITVSGSTGAVTFSLPSSVTIGGTMTAGTFSGSGASLTSIPNGALTNSSLTIGSTNIALGATSTTLAGLTAVTATTFTGALSGNATTATTATNIAGGAAGSIHYQSAASTTATLAAGTSSQVLVSGTTPAWTNTPTLTGTNFSGTASSLSIGGNAATATTLQTARLINGTSFNGSADITITAANPNAVTFNNSGSGAASGSTYTGASTLTVSYNTVGAPSTTGTNASGSWGINITGTAPAGTLTGTTLASGVTASSLTSVGTLSTLTVSGSITSNSGLSLPATNAGIEIGSTSASNTPFMDMHSSGNNIDYDVRLIASGGTGSAGQGTLSIQAANVSASQFTATTFSGSLSGNATTASSTLTLGATGVIYGTTGTSYSTATQVREAGLAGAQGNAATAAPRLAFHWSGVVASSIALETDGTIAIRDNPGTGYEKFHAGAVTVTTLNGGTPSASAGVANRVVYADASGYIQNTYFNSSDNSQASGVTAVMVKAGDNYLRSGTAAAVAAFVGPSITSIGNIATINGTSPPNGAIRLTPNLHLNSSAANAVILNWDNGGSGANQQVRIGNGSGSDIWYITAAGNVSNVGSLAVGVGSSSATQGDITTARAGATTGVVWFGTSASKYLYYDATNFQMQGGGLVVSGDVTAFSDIRVKTNIEVITDALTKVKAIRGVTFNRTDSANDGKRHAGVIAQEVEAVMPEFVSESSEGANGEAGGIKKVAYGNMVGLLIEAIKELNAKVDSLKAEIAALKG